MANDCIWCDEPVLEAEQADAVSEAMHKECLTRMITGSVAHLEKRCSCFVAGSTESDPPGLTRREAARLAWEKWRKYYLDRRTDPKPTTRCGGAPTAGGNGHA